MSKCECLKFCFTRTLIWGNQRLHSNISMWYLDDSCFVELPRQVKSCTSWYLICFHDSKNFRFHTSKAVLAFQNLTSLPSKSVSASKIIIIGKTMNFMIAAFGHASSVCGWCLNSNAICGLATSLLLEENEMPEWLKTPKAVVIFGCLKMSKCFVHFPGS